MTNEQTDRIEVHVADLDVIKERIEKAYRQGVLDGSANLTTAVIDAYERGRVDGAISAKTADLVGRAFDKTFPQDKVAEDPGPLVGKKVRLTHADWMPKLRGTIAEVTAYDPSRANDHHFTLKTSWGTWCARRPEFELATVAVGAKVKVKPGVVCGGLTGEIEEDSFSSTEKEDRYKVRFKNGGWAWYLESELELVG